MVMRDCRRYRVDSVPENGSACPLLPDNTTGAKNLPDCNMKTNVPGCTGDPSRGDRMFKKKKKIEEITFYD